MLITLFYFNVLFIYFVNWNLLDILQGVLASSELFFCAYFIKNLEVVIAQTYIDGCQSLLSKSFQNTIIMFGLQASTKKLILRFPSKIALAILGVSLDQLLQSVRDLLVADGAPQVVEDVLDVL
jgi:hypothetical protein